MLRGAYFAVGTGRLSVRDPASGAFTEVAAKDHARPMRSLCYSEQHASSEGAIS
jgi:hypothetical protein